MIADSVKLFTHNDLQEYLTEDTVTTLLHNADGGNDKRFTSHRWLLDSAPKRLIFQHVYGDILEKKHCSILDVGGGFTSLSRRMVEVHDYSLLDIMAHDPKELLTDLEEKMGRPFWLNQDWYSFPVERQYDYVIANDIFPNVDQRIELFLEKFLPCCKELRLTATFYNEPRFYPTKRLDADEVLYFLAWNGGQLSQVLRKYLPSVDFSLICSTKESLFPNRRVVAYIKLQGNA